MEGRAGGVDRCQTVQCRIDHSKDSALSPLGSREPLKNCKQGEGVSDIIRFLSLWR